VVVKGAALAMAVLEVLVVERQEAVVVQVAVVLEL
jgi:hypothetical protein